MRVTFTQGSTREARTRTAQQAPAPDRPRSFVPQQRAPRVRRRPFGGRGARQDLWATSDVVGCEAGISHDHEARRSKGHRQPLRDEAAGREERKIGRGSRLRDAAAQEARAAQGRAQGRGGAQGAEGAGAGNLGRERGPGHRQRPDRVVLREGLAPSPADDDERARLAIPLQATATLRARRAQRLVERAALVPARARPEAAGGHPPARERRLCLDAPVGYPRRRW